MLLVSFLLFLSLGAFVQSGFEFALKSLGIVLAVLPLRFQCLLGVFEVDQVTRSTHVDADWLLLLASLYANLQRLLNLGGSGHLSSQPLVLDWIFASLNTVDVAG